MKNIVIIVTTLLLSFLLSFCTKDEITTNTKEEDQKEAKHHEDTVTGNPKSCLRKFVCTPVPPNLPIDYPYPCGPGSGCDVCPGNCLRQVTIRQIAGGNSGNFEDLDQYITEGRVAEFFKNTNREKIFDLFPDLRQIPGVIKDIQNGKTIVKRFEMEGDVEDELKIVYAIYDAETGEKVIY